MYDDEISGLQEQIERLAKNLDLIEKALTEKGVTDRERVRKALEALRSL